MKTMHDAVIRATCLLAAVTIQGCGGGDAPGTFARPATVGAEAPQSTALAARSAQAVDRTPPSTPTGLQGAADSPTSVTLSWQPSSDNVGVAKYRVFRDSDLLAEVSGLTHTDTGLDAHSLYTYEVTAVDAAGNVSDLSRPVDVRTPRNSDTTPPTAPANLSATAVSITRVDLGWSASTDNVGVSKYRVLRNGALLAETTATSHADLGTTAGTSYSYQVKALDAAGNLSAASNTVAVTTASSPDTAAPSAPGTLTASAMGATEVVLGWKPSTDNVGVAGYRVYRNGGNTPVATAIDTSLSDLGLGANTSYTYQVAAFDAAGNVSALSNSAVVTTPATDPTPAWKPLTPGTTWNWQIDGQAINQTVLDASANPKKMLDIDLENTPAATIAQLKAQGIYVVCYIEVGSYNQKRGDAAKFKAVPGLIRNLMKGFPDEWWVNVRLTDALMPIMNARLDSAKAKGCDGIEPDLDDSYTENTGVTPKLTIDDSLNYLKLLVEAAHARGMSMGLKNGPGMAVRAAAFADWALNEECNNFQECEGYKEFIKRNKAVFQVEYISNGTKVENFCPADNLAHFDGLLKQSSETLHALPRTPCRGQ